MFNFETFDKLVLELSSHERQELLEKIESSVTFTNEPMHNFSETRPITNMENIFNELPFFLKLIILIKMIFTGRDKIELTAERIYNHLFREIETVTPGYFSPGKFPRISNKFSSDIDTLRQSLLSFQDPLQTALTNDKKDFYAFLGNQYNSFFESNLNERCNPSQIGRANPGLKPVEVKRIMDETSEEEFNNFDRTIKDEIQINLKTLFILQKLTKFPFEQLSESFALRSTHLEGVLLKTIKGPLTELIEILISFNFPPDGKSLKTLFLFHYRNELESPDFNLEEALIQKLTMAQDTIFTIKNFNERFPLVKILQYINFNINFSPMIHGGGEEWFRTYREIWNDRLNLRYRTYARKRAKIDLVKSLERLWKIKKFNQVSPYCDGFYNDQKTVKYAYTVAASVYFLHNILNDKLYSMLNTILLNGKFYKKDNKIDYENAYEEIFQLEAVYSTFLKSMDEKGAIYKEIKEAEELPTPPLQRKEQFDTLFLKIDGEAKRINNLFLRNLNKIKNILSGILSRQSGGRGVIYDTLININELEGSNNNRFLIKLREVEQIVADSYVKINELNIIEDQ